MRSSKDIGAMHERLAKAWSRAVAPDAGAGPGFTVETQLLAAQIALEWAQGDKAAGKTLTEWITEATKEH
jgi:hypothetical protein